MEPDSSGKHPVDLSLYFGGKRLPWLVVFAAAAQTIAVLWASFVFINTVGNLVLKVNTLEAAVAATGKLVEERSSLRGTQLADIGVKLGDLAYANRTQDEHDKGLQERIDENNRQIREVQGIITDFDRRLVRVEERNGDGRPQPGKRDQ